MGIGDTFSHAWSDVTSTLSSAQTSVWAPAIGAYDEASNLYDQYIGTPKPDRLGTAKAAPSGAHHVVLVGGYGGDSHSMDVMKRSLEKDGYVVDVFTPDNGTGSVKDAAKGLAQMVNKVKGESPGGEVNLVTYSAGVSIARTYLSLADADGNVDDHDRQHVAVNNSHKPVHKLVVLDGSWHGDDDSTLENIAGGAEFRDVQRTGPIMSALNSMPDDGLPQGTDVVTVHPEHSEANGGDVKGAQNEHIGDNVKHEDLAERSDEGYNKIRDALD